MNNFRSVLAKGSQFMTPDVELDAFVEARMFEQTMYSRRRRMISTPYWHDVGFGVVGEKAEPMVLIIAMGFVVRSGIRSPYASMILRQGANQ